MDRGTKNSLLFGALVGGIYALGRNAAKKQNLTDGQKLAYSGRPASASPAVGYYDKHYAQQKALLDAAFAKLDPATVETLKTNSDLLTSILTYHVVPGQVIPAQVVGTHKTVQGADLTVTGSGNHLTVNGANVVCGGVKTANATVYLIDTVLLPPAN